MSVLVTGGKGFIGAIMIRKLLALGEKVVCLEPKSSPGRLADIADKVIMVAGDASKMEDVADTIKKHDVKRIAHMVFTISTANPELIHQEVSVMIMGCCNVYEAAKQAGIKRVIFPSSIHRHGAQWLHGEVGLNEESPSLALTIYGVGKRLNETVAHEYNTRLGMSIVSIRIPAVYGPGARVGARGVNLPMMAAAMGSEVVMPYPATEKQCLAHVDDVAEVGVRLLMIDKPPHEVYEIGGHTLSYGQMADLAKTFNPRASFVFGPPGLRSDLPYLIDHSRLRQDLGFEHRSIKDGYQDTIESFRKEAREQGAKETLTQKPTRDQLTR